MVKLKQEWSEVEFVFVLRYIPVVSCIRAESSETTVPSTGRGCNNAYLHNHYKIITVSYRQDKTIRCVLYRVKCVWVVLKHVFRLFLLFWLFFSSSCSSSSSSWLNWLLPSWRSSSGNTWVWILQTVFIIITWSEGDVLTRGVFCVSVQLTREYFSRELKRHYQGHNNTDVFTSTWNAIMTTVSHWFYNHRSISVPVLHAALPPVVFLCTVRLLWRQRPRGLRGESLQAPQPQ